MQHKFCPKCFSPKIETTCMGVLPGRVDDNWAMCHTCPWTGIVEQCIKAERAGLLVTLPEEELKKVPGLTREEIEEALRKGTEKAKKAWGLL